MKRTIAIFVLFWMVAGTAWAQSQVEVFSLRSRPAQEMIPILEPLLQGHGTITGMDNQIIVRTTPENMAIIKQVLGKLDKPLRNLLITVKQGRLSEADLREGEINMLGHLGNEGHIAVNPLPSGQSGVIGLGTTDDFAVRGRVNSGRSSGSDTRTQVVRTLEGRPALIQMGLQVPIVQTQVHGFGRFATQSQTVTFKNVTTGVYVLPRVQGDNVYLEVQPQSADLDARGIQVQEINTTVTGKLGEWIEVGSLLQQSDASHSQILGGSQQSAQQNRTVYLKVEEAP